MSDDSLSHEFEVTDSELIYTGAILALRVDEVTMPGGGRGTREIVEHHGAVAVVALDGDDRVATVRQYRHPLQQRMIELPAGLLDGGSSESPQEAAARELVEEIGFRADRWHRLVDIAASPGFTDETTRIFLARDLTEVGRPPAHDEEADMTVEWIPFDAALAGVLAGEIVNSSSVAGILALAAVRSSGRELDAADAPWPVKATAFARRTQE